MVWGAVKPSLRLCTRQSGIRGGSSCSGAAVAGACYRGGPLEGIRDLGSPTLPGLGHPEARMHQLEWYLSASEKAGCQVATDSPEMQHPYLLNHLAKEIWLREGIKAADEGNDVSDLYRTLRKIQKSII